MEKQKFRLKNLLSWTTNVIHLIYPNSCLICQKELIKSSDQICPFCKTELQYTYFERYEEPTILDQLFWGRVNLKATFALFFFEKGKKVQPILHALKYKYKPEIGVQFGQMIGRKLNDIEGFKGLEALIPVPLHPKKLFVRGYNQSEKLANGISNELNIPVLKDFIVRDKNTETQTKKGRFLRWENVENKFSVGKKSHQEYKHIAIVDDVITTGATLEAIIQSIQKNNPEVCISVISLALAK